MTISMHNSSIPLFALMFENMLKWLDKAQAHADARNFDAQLFLDTKLAPDMVPLLTQVQLATDTATTWVSRLTGTEMKGWEHGEVTLDDGNALRFSPGSGPLSTESLIEHAVSAGVDTPCLLAVAVR